MCGICGVAAVHGALSPTITAAMPAMTNALRHRGPDGQGIFSDPYVVLGHRRLAIIDRAGGKQPLPNEDGTCWVVFNGEIYNHHDLRKELLARGHRFKTRSDTETIVHAYEEYGPRCVERLEGMFAFAVYDQRHRSVLLARDRLGKKPLFYAVLNGVLHFASEIKALAASPAWDSTLNLDALEGYLSLGYFLAPATPYRNVHKLESAHYLVLENGHVTTRRYWDVESFDDYPGSEAQAIDEISEQLDARTRERLESEVPLGAFLSGGIDSGLVVSAMASAMDKPVITTSVGFSDTAYNELELASLTARAFQTVHYPHVVTPTLDVLIDKVVNAFDEPFADSSAIPTYYVSREARRHVTVALTGDGGDETFGGYDFRYVPHAKEALVRPFIATAGLQGSLRSVGAAWPRSPRVPRPLRLGTYLQNLGGSPEAAYYNDLCFLKSANARRLIGRPANTAVWDSPVYEAVTAPYLRCGSHDAVQRAQYADLMVYLPNDVLVKVDRMSMQSSLEVRCPLLDRRIVELAFRLPQSLKRAGSTGKYLLRRLAARRLPPALVSAPKHGFTAPVGAWIAGVHRDVYRQEVLSPNAHVASLIDVVRVRQMFDAHAAGQADHSYALWAIWVLERWSRRQSDRTPHLDAAVETAS